LILFNHYEAAKDLFYQLAVNRFSGGAAMGAQLGQPIDVRAVIADLLEMEDRLHSTSTANMNTIRSQLLTQQPLTNISETNASIADQAASCILNNADMLREYFSIGITKKQIESSKDDHDCIVLDHLPVLLENYTPCIHGLPLFLLWLATEVNWTEEKPCFHDICRELGYFYAQTETHEEDLPLHVRHVLFPAISTLLVPPEDFRPFPPCSFHRKTLSTMDSFEALPVYPNSIAYLSDAEQQFVPILFSSLSIQTFLFKMLLVAVIGTQRCPHDTTSALGCSYCRTHVSIIS
jgi:hypothetical protein